MFARDEQDVRREESVSTLAAVRTSCTRCGGMVEGEVALVVNVDRRPDLRHAVLRGTFNRLDCTACGHRMTVARTVALVDFGRRQWVHAYPAWAEVHWLDLARATEQAVQRNLAFAAPPAIRELAEGMQVRVVFGYDALREKFVAHDAGIDDAELEMAKLSLLAGRPDLAAARILLWEVTPDELRWVVLHARAERVVTSHEVLRADPPGAREEGEPSGHDARLPVGMSPLELRADPFVSYRRWFVAPRPANPLDFDLDGQRYAHAGGAALRAPFDDL